MNGNVFQVRLKRNYPDLFARVCFGDWTDYEIMIRISILTKFKCELWEPPSVYFSRIWRHICDNEELHAIWLL